MNDTTPQDVTPAPALQHITTVEVEVAPISELGTMPFGRRRIIPIISGEVRGPRMNGVVLPGGADWQVVRPDRVIELIASYVIRTFDGVEIAVVNGGIRRASADTMAKLSRGEPVDPSLVYCRTAPKFEAPVDSDYDWLNRSLFVADAERRPDSVRITIFEVL